jgi:hypothetical protein
MPYKYALAPKLLATLDTVLRKGESRGDLIRAAITREVEDRVKCFDEVLAAAEAQGFVRTTVTPDGRTMVYVPPGSPWADGTT